MDLSDLAVGLDGRDRPAVCALGLGLSVAVPRAESGGRGGQLQDACCWASVTVPAQVPPSFQNAAGREARGFSCTSSMLSLDNLIQPPLQSGS